MPLKNKLYRLALRLVHNHTEAQDITQETLVRLWHRLDTLSTTSEAEALGIVTCRNLSLDIIGRAGRNHEPIETQIDTAETDPAFSPLASLSRDNHRQILRQQLNRLPERQKTIIQLRDIEGYTYKEIAQMLQLTEEQVKITLFRARQTLKEACQNKDSYGL